MGGVAYFAWTGRVYGGYCKVLKSSVTSPNLNTNQGYGYKLWEKCPDPSEDCLSARPEPKCEGDTLVTFVEPGTTDSRGCMVYGREENVCAMGHCNAEAGNCDEINHEAPIPCSSNIDVDWACMECGGKQGKACTAKAGFGSSDLVEGKCNANYGCAKALDESYSGTYSVLGQGKGVAISGFAFLGAISLIWHGARAFHKACVKSEFTAIQEA